MSRCVKCFGQVEFDEARSRLRVAGRLVELDRSCLAILSMLVDEARGEVGKDQLLEVGWPGRFVHENSLAKAIGRLRKALGKDGAALETVHGYGYRLAADVRAVPVGERQELGRGRRWYRHPATAVTAVLLGLGVIAAGALALGDDSQAERGVINGEPADSIGRVLWVDDHPENNRAETHFFENKKIAVYHAASSDEALMLLSMYDYGAVISDMGRDGKPLAGLELLRAMRARHDLTPFVLYTVHSSPEQRHLLAAAGGQGVTEKRADLYATILAQFGEIAPAPQRGYAGR